MWMNWTIRSRFEWSEHKKSQCGCVLAHLVFKQVKGSLHHNSKTKNLYVIDTLELATNQFAWFLLIFSIRADRFACRVSGFCFMTPSRFVRLKSQTEQILINIAAWPHTMIVTAHPYWYWYVLDAICKSLQWTFPIFKGMVQWGNIHFCKDRCILNIVHGEHV